MTDPGRATPEPARTFVVKLGGDVLEEPARGAVAHSLRQARGQTPGRYVVVHGGGAQSTALAARLGIETKLVAGRRITDAPMLEILQMVVAGRLNVELCAALRRNGLAAVGLHAGSGVIRARRRPPRVVSGGGPDPVDFGLVGDVTGFDRTLLETLLAGGYVPVLSCLALADGGAVLNINADLAASQLAAALGAEALIAVTAVGGVRREPQDPATRIPRLRAAQARAAIADGTVYGGMIPKLEEACASLEAGVGAVHIVAPDEIAPGLNAPGSVGTLLER
jgi:acetylglutamate kinase